LRKIVFREFHGPRSSKWSRFLGIIDRNAPFATISEFFLDLVGEMAGTHDQVAYPLRSQLPNKQLKERCISDRSERFGSSRHHRLQSRPDPADEKSSSHVLLSSIQLRRSLCFGVHREGAIQFKFADNMAQIFQQSIECVPIFQHRAQRLFDRI
jgi:hypothetical protein